MPLRNPQISGQVVYPNEDIWGPGKSMMRCRWLVNLGVLREDIRVKPHIQDTQKRLFLLGTKVWREFWKGKVINFDLRVEGQGWWLGNLLQGLIWPKHCMESLKNYSLIYPASWRADITRPSPPIARLSEQKWGTAEGGSPGSVTG